MQLNSDEIEKLLPHRYPFLLVDRITECEPGKLAVGRKCVTANEPFFQGHFPGRKIMPGVLILEALAQTGTVDGFPVRIIKIVLVHFQQLLSAAIHHPLDQGFDLLMNGDFPVGACFGFDAADHIAFVQVDIFKEDG